MINVLLYAYITTLIGLLFTCDSLNEDEYIVKIRLKPNKTTRRYTYGTDDFEFGPDVGDYDADDVYATNRHEQNSNNNIDDKSKKSLSSIYEIDDSKIRPNEESTEESFNSNSDSIDTDILFNRVNRFFNRFSKINKNGQKIDIRIELNLKNDKTMHSIPHDIISDRQAKTKGKNLYKRQTADIMHVDIVEPACSSKLHTDFSNDDDFYTDDMDHNMISFKQKLLLDDMFNSDSGQEESDQFGNPRRQHFDKSNDLADPWRDYRAQNRIVGGDPTDIDNHPYYVGYGNSCGGVIIGDEWVLTAAHCGSKSKIYAGSKFFKKGDVIRIKRHIYHPFWKQNRKKGHAFDYDFQILELEHKLKFNDNIQPIKFGRANDIRPGAMITVSGLGSISEDGPYSEVLRSVTVPIVPKSTCQQVPYSYFNGTLTSTMFCAGYSDQAKDACQGDSGGPAVHNSKLIGIVSFGYGCATPGAYGVYSKVTKVLPWIRKTTGLHL